MTFHFAFFHLMIDIEGIFRMKRKLLNSFTIQSFYKIFFFPFSGIFQKKIIFLFSFFNHFFAESKILTFSFCISFSFLLKIAKIHFLIFDFPENCRSLSFFLERLIDFKLKAIENRGKRSQKHLRKIVKS